MISNSALSAERAEDSNFLNSLSITPHNKRQRQENGRYKGVVLQQNGHWGAQIYANHKRYWLGTFKSEKAAAMAYDSAAIKLRSEESHRNFPGTDLTLQEEMFQNGYSTETILNMIKDGSYETKLADFIKSQSPDALSGSCGDLKSGPSGHGELLCYQLFQKELTPSDVGKLNRLVIPKKHATKYFPEVSLTEGEEGGVDDIQLVFYDRRLKSWKFRYCYWKSSQSFVFTRGWNRFVKDKDLKAKDVVTFYRCEYGEGFEELKWFCMIDVEYSSGERGNGDPGGKEKIELQLGLGRICGRDLGRQCREEDEKDNDLEEDDTPMVERGVKLFGVHITS